MVVEIVQHSQSFKFQLAAIDHSFIFVMVSLILNSSFKPFVVIDIVIKVIFMAFVVVVMAASYTTATQDTLANQSLSSMEENLKFQQIVITATTEDSLIVN